MTKNFKHLRRSMSRSAQTQAKRRAREMGHKLSRAKLKTVHAMVVRDGSSFVATCAELPVVTQGRSLDEVAKALRETVALHLEGEDLVALGFPELPRVLVQYEISLAAKNAKSSRAAKRELASELSEGIIALAESRKGARILRTHPVSLTAVPQLTPREFLRVRRQLEMSKAVFAACLGTSVRTLENWEQGRAKPNAQAALLISLVKRFPDTVARLAAI